MTKNDSRGNKLFPYSNKCKTNVDPTLETVVRQLNCAIGAMESALCLQVVAHFVELTLVPTYTIIVQQIMQMKPIKLQLSHYQNRGWITKLY